MKKYWTELLITSLKDNEIFVFGSNPEGRHGAGSAKAAIKFGAKYGKGRGLQGKTYAIPTKNLTPNFYEKEKGILYKKYGNKSLTIEQIKENIAELYQAAKENPEKDFLIAYTIDFLNKEQTKFKEGLNGYNSFEMLTMFLEQPEIPSNIVFHESYFITLKRMLFKQIDLIFQKENENLIKNLNEKQIETLLNNDLTEDFFVNFWNSILEENKITLEDLEINEIKNNKNIQAILNLLLKLDEIKRFNFDDIFEESYLKSNKNILDFLKNVKKLSNGYPTLFTYANVGFYSVNHFLLAQKALFFQRSDLFHEIIEAHFLNEQQFNQYCEEKNKQIEENSLFEIKDKWKKEKSIEMFLLGQELKFNHQPELKDFFVQNKDKFSELLIKKLNIKTISKIFEEVNNKTINKHKNYTF